MARQDRILLLSEMFPPKTGGSSRWFWEIYRRLPHEAVVIAAGNDPREADFDHTHNLRIHRLPLTLPTWGVANLAGLKGYTDALRKLTALTRAEEISMVHCGRCLPEGLMALILKYWYGLPYACYVHGEEMNYASGSRELRWLARRVLFNATFVIANSRNTQAILTKEWKLLPKRIRLFHPGVDAERFRPVARDLDLRNQLGWGDRPVVLTVGRLQRRKGHDTMILALDAIRRKVPNVLYAIAGDGEERQSLEVLVARTGQSGHVQFLGEIHDQTLVQCYQQCDLFVLANRQVGQDIEGFGMVLVEAQACGKPVIAGASGGTAETMQIPQTGRIVDCTTPDLLAATVSELLADPKQRQQMGEDAREWVVEQLDWVALSERASQLFQLPARVPTGSPSVGHSPQQRRSDSTSPMDVSPKR